MNKTHVRKYNWPSIHCLPVISLLSAPLSSALPAPHLPPSISHPSPPPPGQDPPALPLPSFTYSPYTALGRRPACCATLSYPACIPCLHPLLRALPAPADPGHRRGTLQQAADRFSPQRLLTGSVGPPPQAAAAPPVPGPPPGRTAGKERVAGAAPPGRRVASPVRPLRSQKRGSTLVKTLTA